MRWQDYKVDELPSGEVGDWVVRKFRVSKSDSFMTQITAMQHGRGHVPAGRYWDIKDGEPEPGPCIDLLREAS